MHFLVSQTLNKPLWDHNPLQCAAVDDQNGLTRGAFVSSTCALLSSVLLPPASFADDISADAQPQIKSAPSVTACKIDAKNCVSTLNIKQIDSYSPPWTFEVSPDEAFARIKGVLTSDDLFKVTEMDADARYIRATVQRDFRVQDEVEFLVKGDDKVVVFRSSEIGEGSISDFGEIRRRMDSIRKRGAVFDLMGGGLTADSYDGGGAAKRGNGALGQLKAFYGLQKGEGFQSVFEDEE